MPILALHPAEADRLYELIGYPDAWEHEPETTRLSLSSLSKDTVVRDGQLFKKVGDLFLPYVRPSLRPSIVLQAHKDTGHGGIAKTYDWLVKNYYWESMRILLPDVLASCHECQLQRPRATPHEFKLVLPKHAFYTVSIDAIGPFPRTRSGCRFILIAVDHFSKWVEARATKDITAKTTASFLLQDIFYRHGCPQVLLSDNGTNFNARLIASIVEAMGTHQNFSAPYNPSTNGAVERANSSLVTILRKLTHSDASNWDLYLPAALFAYRLSKHRTTGFSPFAMLYGREATTPSILGPPLVELDAATNPESHVRDLVNRVIDIQATAYTTAYKTKTMELSPANASRAPVPEFAVGDQVLYYQHRIGGRAHKLDSLWIGPLIVTFKRGSEYTVKLLSSGRPFARVHAKFLRAYTPPLSNLEGGSVVNSPIHALTIGQQGGTHHGLNEEPLSFPFSPLVLYLALSGATPIMDDSGSSASPLPLLSPILSMLRSSDEYK